MEVVGCLCTGFTLGQCLAQSTAFHGALGTGSVGLQNSVVFVGALGATDGGSGGASFAGGVAGVTFPGTGGEVQEGSVVALALAFNKEISALALVTGSSLSITVGASIGTVPASSDTLSQEPAIAGITGLTGIETGTLKTAIELRDLSLIHI